MPPRYVLSLTNKKKRKKFLLRPLFHPNPLLLNQAGPSPSPPKSGHIQFRAFSCLDDVVRGCPRAWTCTPQLALLVAPVNRGNKACAREMSPAGLLMREPNEYEWSLHKCSFVSLNSFTPHWSWKGYSELNVNHIFTGTKQISVSFLKNI